MIFQHGRACGEGIEGVCATGTVCAPGVPSYCVSSTPVDNSTTTFNVVQGFGRPMGQIVPEGTADDPIPVFIICTDANFSGNCIEWLLACDFCVPFGAGWNNDISSIEMLDTRVGCNFWVSSNCVGDGINIDSGAIYDLSATNYNDRVNSFNCYLTGR
ncbi:hypothetical protein C8J56DRAFT_786853 [Mycena floridula]|nr:hypothetical protein C8J56DRAFT_786853 [Mycena floridula]